MERNYRAELTGVFGDPVDGNPTIVVNEAAYAACGLNYRYLNLKVTRDDFDDAMKGLKAMHFKGINLTMPHKLAVLPYLDELSEAASLIGAVNTVLVREDGTLFGENSDGKGFVTALKRAGEEISGKKVAMLGAGGAAKAIAVECALAGAREVVIINRTRSKALELAEVINTRTGAKAVAMEWSKEQSVPADTDIFINATCIGLKPDGDKKPEIDYDSITERMVVTDVVFNPADTLFLKEARARGAKTISGLGMLACQAALNFTIWTGREAPLELMEEKLRAEFEQD